MQAILTKYIGPTNTKGARVQAKTVSKTMTFAWDYSLDEEGNYRNAAHEMCIAMAKLSQGDAWNNPTFQLVSGCLPNGDYCHVLCKVAA